MMPPHNTPPSSPHHFEVMNANVSDEEEEVIEAGDISEVIDLPESRNAEDVDSDDSSGSDGASLPDMATRVFSKHNGAVFCCHLEPKEGKLVVTGGQDDRGFVWDVVSGEIIFQCSGHKDSITHVQFSHDGAYVATGDLGGTIQAWKVSSHTLMWKTQVGDINWLKWHHGANVLVAGTVDGEVYVWRIPSGETKILSGHGSKCECGVIMPDGKRCVVGYRDSSIKVFDMKSTLVLHHIKPTAQVNDGFTCIDAHNDNNMVIAGTFSGRAVLVTTQTGKIVGVLNCLLPSAETSEEVASVESVEFYKNGAMPVAATGSLDGTLIIWDTAHQSVRHSIKIDFGVVKLQWHKKKPLVFIAGLKGRIEVYDALNGTRLSRLSGHSEDVLDFSMNNSILVSGSDDATARVFSLIPLAMDQV